MHSSLELEHVIGFSGRNSHTLEFHPQNKNYMMYPIGAVLVISDMADPHNQSFMKAHDEEITCLCVSKSGRFAATSQLASSKRKGNFATVVVWNLKSKKAEYQIDYHVNLVYSLCFTHDDRFLLTSGESGLCVWDMENGKLAGGLKFEKPVQFVKSAPPSEDFNPRRPEYTLVAATENQVRVCKWKFDIKSMQFMLSSEICALPGRIAGFNRTYLEGAIDDTGSFCYAGTKTGEIIVFAIKNAIFRTSEQVSSNGVQSLCPFGSELYVGSGDGTIKHLRGSDTKWSLVRETKISGSVTSLCLSSDGNLLLAGTDHGSMFLVSVNDFRVSLLEESHTKAVVSASFDGADNECFCSASQDGTMRVWDLSDYSSQSAITCSGRASCSIFLGTHIVSGWEDGFIRCHNVKTKQLKWEISAHRGKIVSIDCNEKYVCSGGDDNVIRVWSTVSQEMLGQFSDHKKSVTQVLIDVEAPHLLHSCSMDKTVITLDMKTNRRIAYHALPGSASLGLSSMSQKYDGDFELVTCGLEGKLMFWDIDYPDPVKVLNDPDKSQLLCVAVSPSGKYLAVGSEDELVKIWNLKTGTIIAQGSCHSASVLSVAWSPDEKQLVSTSKDCSIAIWNFYP